MYQKLGDLLDDWVKRFGFITADVGPPLEPGVKRSISVGADDLDRILTAARWAHLSGYQE